MSCVKPCQVKLLQDDFGKYKDENGKSQTVKRFTWINGNHVSVQVINYGGYITSIKVPDKNGKVEDIVIGFDSIEGYLRPENKYFGATIGRVANRIAKGRMNIEGQSYTLAANNGRNHLHGGIRGFDKVLWDAHVQGTKVVLSYCSGDMEEGYPGILLINVTFELNHRNEFSIDYKACTSKPTTVNLTNHSYFNLAGHDKGSRELYKHIVAINADRFTDVDKESIPTGKLPSVGGTIFDLRIPKLLGDVINDVPNSPGYDHNFCITKGSNQDDVFVAKVSHPASGRSLEVYSNQPGVQFYTGNFLPEDNSLLGKHAFIRKHGAFCLETQLFPDAINQIDLDFENIYIKWGLFQNIAFELFTSRIKDKHCKAILGKLDNETVSEEGLRFAGVKSRGPIPSYCCIQIYS